MGREGRFLYVMLNVLKVTSKIITHLSPNGPPQRYTYKIPLTVCTAY